MNNIRDLEGKTLINIKATEEEILFETSEGEEFRMFHTQECCESVTVEEIVGDLSDLLNTPVLFAEERTSTDPRPNQPVIDDCFTWTFYEIRTIKGSVTIRWFGYSNGYYSERVSFSRQAPARSAF